MTVKLRGYSGPHSPIVTSQVGSVLVIAIDRIDVRNAFDLATAAALEATLDKFEARDDLGAAVLTGNGGHFSSGMDLKAFRNTGERPIVPRRGPFGIIGLPPNKPIVAAVEGAAYGGGFEVALACDLIVAAEGARFALPEVKRGLLAAANGALVLPTRLPYHLAMEMVLTGEALSSRRAHEFGMVNRITADGDALNVAIAMAETIIANGPLAVRAAKRLLLESCGRPRPWQLQLQASLADGVRDSADAEEGARAFADKRKPQWQSR